MTGDLKHFLFYIKQIVYGGNRAKKRVKKYGYFQRNKRCSFTGTFADIFPDE